MAPDDYVRALQRFQGGVPGAADPPLMPITGPVVEGDAVVYRSGSGRWMRNMFRCPPTGFGVPLADGGDSRVASPTGMSVFEVDMTPVIPGRRWVAV